MSKIRVLQILNNMSSGGIEAVVMNYYRNINRDEVQFDFAVSENSTLPQREEIEKMGGKIYLTPSIKHFFKYRKRIAEIIKEGDYKIVHCHMGPLAVFPLGVAKKLKVPVRICHNHTTSSKNEFVRNLAKKLLKPFAKKNANTFFACSELAGRWIYGDKFFDSGKVKVINNAIDLEKFAYNKKVRDEVRKELGIENNFVVGHIGRFNSQKNHTFLIDIFAEVSKKREDAVLVLVGEGPLQEEIKQKVSELGLIDKVKFLGVRKDANRLYQAFDAFVLPSLYEGLGMVAVEAQVAGVPTYLSTEVPVEAKISDIVKFISLQTSPKEWGESILTPNNMERIANWENAKIKGFDIKTEAKKLEKFYKECEGKING